jgi:hypothetical protein
MFYHSTFRLNETHQGFEGGRQGGGNFGGKNDGRGPGRCYNCDEKGNIERDCPLPIRPWCSHYRNNTHSTEHFPDLISKWEECARKRGDNMINYDPIFVAKGKDPNINNVTRGGTKTGVNIESPH